METSASLLERLRIAPDEAAWRRLDELYRPLIRRWLLRDPSLREEAEDVVQEVMGVLVRELPGFRRRRNGSFRRWLRTITAHRLSALYRSRRNRPVALGCPLEESPLAQLADPNSEMSRQWDREHDCYVLSRLLELITPLFEPTTLAAFRRVAFEGIAPAQAAEELGVSLNAVLIAKSRVLSQLRQEAKGLID
ncbi:MAG TPA: sigma-70 family RNA polymerase sigma factor [Gemmataceae bacterium]|jgi:RNA polymerase sigma-70 factor (ECF subfamily)